MQSKAAREGRKQDDWSNRWHLIESEARQLSLSLKHHILESLIATVGKPQAKHEEYEVMGVIQLLNQIYHNMQFTEGIQGKTSSLEFKANLQFLLQIIQEMVSHYELVDWKELLMEATYLKQPVADPENGLNETFIIPPSEKVDLNSLLCKKFIFVKELVSLLKDIDILGKYTFLRK
jgi:hypothetical protein